MGKLEDVGGEESAWTTTQEKVADRYTGSGSRSRNTIIGAVMILILVVAGVVLATADDDDPTALDPGTCTDLTEQQVATLLDGWNGEGLFRFEAATRAATSDGGGFGFTHVFAVKGSAPGVSSEIFTFATDGESADDTDGLIVGANQRTRDLFDWGAAETPGSPLARAAGDAFLGAPRCLR